MIIFLIFLIFSIPKSNKYTHICVYNHEFSNFQVCSYFTIIFFLIMNWGLFIALYKKIYKGFYLNSLRKWTPRFNYLFIQYYFLLTIFRFSNNFRFLITWLFVITFIALKRVFSIYLQYQFLFYFFDKTLLSNS